MAANYDINNWYTLFTVTGEEDKVKERILYRFGDELKVLVPKRKLRERKGGTWEYVTRTLFPGYVLINGDINVDMYYGMKDIPGLIKLLRSESEPTPIQASEMEILSRIICNSEIIGMSDVLIEDDRVIVIDGPLASMEGMIESINKRKGRAKVKLSFMGETRTVELGISILKPTE